VQLTSNKIFVAHNVSFDYNFIRKEFKDLGFDYIRKTMCTVELSRKLLPGHASYSLGKLCNDLDIQIIGRHRAEGDALATVELLKNILIQYEMKGKNIFN
jgi:DNA polymerase III subunit epsilon